MLLSNLTAGSTACSILLTLKVRVIPDDRLSNFIYPIESRCGSCPAPVPYPSAEAKEVLALPLLIDAFVEGAQIAENISKRTRKAHLHFLSNVFANMTIVSAFILHINSHSNHFQSPIGRNYFLSPQPTTASKPNQPLEYPLAKLVVFTEHEDTIRRGGVAAAIK